MEKISLIFIICLLAYHPLSGQDPQYAQYDGEQLCQSSDWKIIFQDDFMGTALDTNRWYTYFPYAPGGLDTCQFCRTHSTTATNQIFKNENVKVSDGLLHLQVKNEPVSWRGYESQYSAGMIHSKEAIKDYARYEIRCKIPHDDHITAAFWAFGWSTEIDVFELSGRKYKNLMMTVHKWSDNGTSRYNSGFLKYFNFWEDFHVYTVIYDPYFIRFYVDYQLVHTKSRFVTRRGRTIDECYLENGESYRINPIYPRVGNPLQIIANTAVDSFRERTLPENGQPALLKEFLIDYIRVYQRTANSNP